MIRHIILSSVLLSLAACSALGLSEDKPKAMCPQVAVLRELERVDDYGRDEPEKQNMVAAAIMNGVAGECEYTEVELENGKYNGGNFVVSNYIEADSKHSEIFRSQKESNFWGEVEGSNTEIKKGVDVSFVVKFIAGKGPRLGGNNFSVPYFVSIIDPQNNIVGKEILTANFEFKRDEKTLEKEESLHVFIPTPGKDMEAKDFRVLLGFQLTEDQLKTARDIENRRRNQPPKP